MFIEYASTDDICNAISPYKVGDRIVLLNNIELNEGFFEKGTEMIVSEIHLKASVNGKIRKDSLSDYSFVGKKAFRYTLVYPDNSDNQKKCYCYETDICCIDSKEIIVNSILSDFDRKAGLILSIILILAGIPSVFLILTNIIRGILDYNASETGTYIGLILMLISAACGVIYFSICDTDDNPTICRISEIKGRYVIRRENSESFSFSEK